MPQDAYTLKRVASELAAIFTGGKISKINQPERDCLSLLIYTRKGNLKLEISASPSRHRISLTDCDKQNPKVAPNFCMLLRKHLQNAEITAIAQCGFERVIVFNLKCFSEFSVTEMQLYCEIMGKYSNVILVRDGIIVGAMKTAALEANAKRVILAGAKYKLPERQDKADPTCIDQLKALFEHAEGDRAKFLSRTVAGVAYSTALDMVELYGENLTPEQVYEYVNGDGYEPCVVYDGGEPKDFRVRSAGGNKTSYPTLLDAQRAYYDAVYVKNTFEEKKRKLSSALSAAIKKLEKRLAIVAESLHKCEDAEEIKLKGELITANIYAIQRGQKSFEAVNYYDENLSAVEIALDPRLTPAQNAQAYFKRYAKLKRTRENALTQNAELGAKLDYLKSIDSYIYAAECISDLSETEEELVALKLISTEPVKGRKQKSETPFRKFSIGKITILCGRNNAQNDRLVKSLSPENVWLHTKSFHSSHVAILCDGEADDDTILAAAEICAYFSEAREKDKVQVDYTLKKHVKKPAGANPGFVNYTDFRTIIVAPKAHDELRCDDD